MEDTKKLIEKYKRELMELSRSTPARPRGNGETPLPKAVLGAETSERGNVSESESTPQTAEKVPTVIGYIADNGTSDNNGVEDNEIERVNNSTDDSPFTFDDFDGPKGNVMTDSEEFLSRLFDEKTSSAENTAREQPAEQPRRNNNIMAERGNTQSRPATAEQREFAPPTTETTPNDGYIGRNSEFAPPTMETTPNNGYIERSPEREQTAEQPRRNNNVMAEQDGVQSRRTTAPPTMETTPNNGYIERSPEREQSAEQPRRNNNVMAEQGNTQSRPERQQRDIPQSEMERGSGKPISDFPVAEFATEDEFEEQNTGAGMLEFRVFSANQALPIEGAEISVSTKINNVEQRMFTAWSNSSGETENFTLPAPLRALSQDSENTIQPFSLYDAYIEKAGYTKVILRDIPIFDGVVSIQRVAMIPESDDNAPAENITEVPNAQ